MIVQPYLDFAGRCAEALEFYKKALGAKVIFSMRWGESPDPKMRVPGMDDKIMHASFTVGETTLMAADGPAKTQAKFEGIALSIKLKTDAEAQRVFAALSEGGKVNMPLMKTFFATQFGMVADRFGVGWMVICDGK
jgi:PhnB protein